LEKIVHVHMQYLQIHYLKIKMKNHLKLTVRHAAAEL